MDRWMKVTKSRLEQKTRRGERIFISVQPPNPPSIKHKGFREWKQHLAIVAETTLLLLLSRNLACWDCARLLMLDLSRPCFRPWPGGRGGAAAGIQVGCLAEMWRAYGSFIRTHWEPVLEGMRKLNALPTLCWALVLWSPNFSQAVKSEDLQLKQQITRNKYKTWFLPYHLISPLCLVGMWTPGRSLPDLLF